MRIFSKEHVLANAFAQKAIGLLCEENSSQGRKQSTQGNHSTERAHAPNKRECTAGHQVEHRKELSGTQNSVSGCAACPPRGSTSRRRGRGQLGTLLPTRSMARTNACPQRTRSTAAKLLKPLKALKPEPSISQPLRSGEKR